MATVGLFSRRRVDAAEGRPGEGLPSGSTVTRTPAPYDVPAPGSTFGMVTRHQAMRVPAVRRARNLLAITVGQLPLKRWDETGTQAKDSDWLLTQPDPDLPRISTMAWTIDDLLFHGLSYWRVLDRYPEDNRPKRCRRVDPTTVWISEDATEATVNGKPVKVEDLKRFEGIDDGVLKDGGFTLLTSVYLDAAARHYAENPLPASALLPDPAAIPLGDTEIDATLARWKSARQSGDTAYLAAGKLETYGWSARELQLVEARQYAALEVSRITGVPAEFLDAEFGGAKGMTYRNGTQLRRDLIDFSAAGYLTAISERLSMIDMVPRGWTVRFDTAGFYRNDLPELAKVFTELIPLGVLNADEARAMLDLVVNP